MTNHTTTPKPRRRRKPHTCQCGHRPHAMLRCAAPNPDGDDGRCWCLASPKPRQPRRPRHTTERTNP